MSKGLNSSRSGPLACALAVGIALASAPAAAQQKDLAQLRQIFADGRTAEDNGKWADALEKFKEVAAEKMTPQVRFHIALCEENLGKLVSAKRGFDLAAAEGTAAGSSAVEVPPAAKQHSDALAARIGKVTLDVKGKVGSSKVLLDDVPVGAKDLGAEIEVDPGPHTVVVRDADGKETLRKDVTVAEKGAEHVELAIGDEPPSAPSEGGPSRKLAYIVGGAGLGAFAVSGIFFGLRAANVAQVKATCTNQVALTGCSPADQGLANTGKAYTGVADTFVALGIAGLGTGVVLYFVLGDKKTSSASTTGSSSVWVAPQGSGLRVGGRF